MIVMVSSVVLAISVLLAAFVSFAPNVYSIVEKDFRRRAVSNANLSSIQLGVLKARTGTLTTGNTFILPDGSTTGNYLFRDDASITPANPNGEESYINGSVRRYNDPALGDTLEVQTNYDTAAL